MVAALLFAAPCGCGRPARVIPAEKMTRIYQDMFLADQWLRDNPEARKKADTTLFFDPIFRSYGYSFEDYDRSVQYYLDHPDKYAKILNRASERLRKESTRMQQAADDLTARDYELDRFRRGYTPRDFSTDSLRWSGPETLWPVYVDPASLAVDSTAVAADSAAVASDSLAVAVDSLAVTLDTAAFNAGKPRMQETGREGLLENAKQPEVERNRRIRLKDLDKEDSNRIQLQQ